MKTEEGHCADIYLQGYMSAQCPSSVFSSRHSEEGRELNELISIISEGMTMLLIYRPIFVVLVQLYVHGGTNAIGPTVPVINPIAEVVLKQVHIRIH